MPLIIPDKIHVERIAHSADDIVGFMIPVINDGTYSTKVGNAKRKCGRQALESIEFDNVPTSGYSFMNLSRRYSTQNTFWRIVTPWNFQAEISSENLFHLINECTIKDGLIESEVVWIKNGSELYLTHTESDMYKEAVSTDSYCAKVSLRDVKPGYVITLREGTKDETFEYFGGIHNISMRVNLDGNNGVTYINSRKKSAREYFYKNTKTGKIEHKSSIIVTSIISKDVISPQDAVNKLKDETAMGSYALNLKPFSADDAKIELVKDTQVADYDYRYNNDYLVRIKNSNKLYRTRGYDTYYSNISLDEIEDFNPVPGMIIELSTVQYKTVKTTRSYYNYKYYESISSKCNKSDITEIYRLNFIK